MYDDLIKDLREKAEFLTVAEPLNIKNAFAETMKQAADAIEELNKLHETQKKNLSVITDAYMKSWIPVTEPSIHSGWYFTACNEWGGSAVRKAFFDEATRKWLEFPCGGPKDITQFVTHYMPMPEPPKEDRA